uniref:Uncharacterized protein n=1 Tax=Ovis aries TaxID=9940 RepID=A0AC11EP46_SHEEP
MVKLSKEAKQRLQQLFKGGQFAIRWGFIPLVIYLGFKRGADPGMPEPTVLRIAATASKSLQSYLTLCNPIDGSPPGSPVPGILQLTLGIKDCLVIWFWKQSMQRNNMEGVLSGWDKRWDIVQTVTSWMAQGSYFSDASVAEWNLY